MYIKYYSVPLGRPTFLEKVTLTLFNIARITNVALKLQPRAFILFYVVQAVSKWVPYR